MLPPKNPAVATTYNKTADDQSPLATKCKDMVMTIPMNEKNMRNFFLDDPLSAIAPRTGASKAMTTPATELASPSLAVLTLMSAPALQYFLKKMGKKPAMTVVAKAELAQSYIAHPKIAFLLSFCSANRISLPSRQCFKGINFPINSPYHKGET